MPALISYTPYETLVFFQNVAQHGVDTSSLQDISAALKQNHFIRESSEFDATKFSPDALQHLYDRTIGAQPNGDSGTVNGDAKVVDVNPLKRKLSTTPPPRLNQDPEQLVQRFVDKLYAQFKAEAIRELRRHEQEYEELQHEILRLEEQAKPSASSLAQTPNLVNEVDEHSRPGSVHGDRRDHVSDQPQAKLHTVNGASRSSQHEAQEDSVIPTPALPPSQDRAQASPVPSQRATNSQPGSSSGTPVPRPALPPSVPSQTTPHHSPVAYNRTLPPPSPQRGTYGPLPPPPNVYPSHQQTQAQQPMLSSLHTMQRVPSHEPYPHQRPTSQGRASPLSQHPQPAYPQYNQYQQPPPPGWHSPSPQYPQPQHYQPPPQHYPPPPPNRYAQVHTPNQPPYPPYPHTAPVPYPPQQLHAPQVAHYHQYPASASTTPVPRPQVPSPVARSESSTPWKRSSTLRTRPRSPSRLDREISPLSDHEEAPVLDGPKRRGYLQLTQESSTRPEVENRGTSTTSVVPASRSQSVTSASPAPEASDQQQKRPARRPPKGKAEPPSTPAPNTSESEEHQQRSSGRRGRARTGVGAALLATQPTTTTNKRKREDGSPSPVPTPVAHARSSSHIQPKSVNRAATQHTNPDFVLVSRSFGKTSLLLLNEVTSHKLAGIFAKPLSERDAPGYKDLIFRTQDLKSIKVAITKGSKAAVAAIEDLEARPGSSDDEEAIIEGDVSTGTEGLIGNGFYLVRATEDLLPPKGIVNFAQLEMELVRMFANAVMFNPLPSSERGFGPDLRVRKRGGRLLRDGEIRGKLPDEVTTIDHDEESEDEEDRGQKDPSNPGTASALESGSESESENSSSSSGSPDSEEEDGGIISDTREMFKDVEDLVARWRELEGEKMTGGNLSQQMPSGGSGERQGSVSAASSPAGDEDKRDRDGTPTGMAGSVRKRRRVGDLQ